MIPFPDCRGLSPRLRGRPIQSGSAACIRTVYPRAYGEGLTCTTTPKTVQGLSPRLRGRLWYYYERKCPDNKLSDTSQIIPSIIGKGKIGQDLSQQIIHC